MTDQPLNSEMKLSVLIAGAGVAGLEAAFALRELAGDRITVTLLAPAGEFAYRPLAIAEPFTSGRVKRYPLARLASEAGAELVHDTLEEVDPVRRSVRTGGGARIDYDALLVCPGVRAEPALDAALTIDDARMDELLHGLVQDVEDGYVRRVAVVVPAPVPWPLPAYELALMLSERAWDMQVDTHVTLLTPEQRPLAVFGTQASLELSRLLADRHVDVITSAYCEMPTPRTVEVHPGDRTFEFDRVVALPHLRGPAIDGLPYDGGGFLPVDEYGKVRGVEHVWAAGDATDFPVKHGGVAAQMADTAAQSIAAAAGACEAPPPFDPEVAAVLLTGATPRAIKGHLTGRQPAKSAMAKVAYGSEPPKIVARYLSPHLDTAEATASA
jgi:sulfide:quinone oxidoreductase